MNSDVQLDQQFSESIVGEVRNVPLHEAFGRRRQQQLRMDRRADKRCSRQAANSNPSPLDAAPSAAAATTFPPRKALIIGIQEYPGNVESALNPPPYTTPTASMQSFKAWALRRPSRRIAAYRRSIERSTSLWTALMRTTSLCSTLRAMSGRDVDLQHRTLGPWNRTTGCSARTCRQRSARWRNAWSTSRRRTCSRGSS